MRLFYAFAFMFFSLVSFSGVQAATQSSTNSQAAELEKTKKAVKKTTDVSFDDILVQGRYNFSDEAVTTVEEDKVLDALLGVRKDFDDRVKISRDQH